MLPVCRSSSPVLKLLLPFAQLGPWARAWLDWKQKEKSK